MSQGTSAADITVWVNGKVGTGDQVEVLALDHGMTVGDGAFETIKVLHGQAFALRRHIARFERSLRGLGMSAPPEDQVRQAVAEVTAGTNDPLGRLRLTYTAGPGPLGSERIPGEGTLMAAYVPAAPWPANPSAVVVPWVRNERSPLVGLKTTSYAENVVALEWARHRGASEGLFADTQGRLSEGTGSNVFLVVNDRVLTPSMACGPLGGITRALVLEWAAEEGLDVTEGEWPVEIVREATEVFLTSATRGVQSLAAVDGGQVDVDGPWGRRLREMFQRRSEQSMEP